MSAQLELDQVDDDPAPDFRPGDVVRLVNSHGLAVVGLVRRGGGRVHTPNPTLARVIDPDRRNAAGIPLVDVRLLDGPRRGQLVAAHPNVVRLVSRTGPEPFGER